MTVSFLLVWAIISVLYLFYWMNNAPSGRGNVIDAVIAAPILLLLILLIGRKRQDGAWEIDLNDLNRRD